MKQAFSWTVLRVDNTLGDLPFDQNANPGSHAICGCTLIPMARFRCSMLFLAVIVLQIGVGQSVLSYYARATGSQVKLQKANQTDKPSPVTSAIGQFTINIYNSSYADGVAYLANMGGAFMAHVHVGNVTAIATFPESNQPAAWTWNSTLPPPLNGWVPIDIIEEVRFGFTFPPSVVPVLSTQLKAGTVYMDVHSTSYKMGEIRGLMLKAVSDGGK